MEKNTKIVSALRILSTDAINKAKSGHPGICLGAAPIIEALFTNVMNITPKNKRWINRDRFVLSAGHGVPLLYSALHFAGYDISMDDIKNLRQLHRITAGHPEYDLVEGIDASTGPLGQGIAIGVGMALAERYNAAYFNKEDIEIVDNYTYVLCGDGCLQEGIASEALSFCGHQKLNKFILLFDSNKIQLDGSTDMAISENFKAKFEAMGFNYYIVKEGNSVEKITSAINKAKNQKEKPSIIEVCTEIGYGTLLAGTSACHGSPIGEENSKVIREKFGWDYPPFEIPSDVYTSMQEAVENNGGKKYDKWTELLEEYKVKYPEMYQKFEQFLSNKFVAPLMKDYELGYSEATRKTCSYYLAEYQKVHDNVLGGCADLANSTYAKGINGNHLSDNILGRNICYGVREHAMGAITNGLNLYGNLRAFCGGFFVFTDYMKPAIRMSALMKIPAVYIFSHDSIMVGEDGPTHQPIEQLEALRTIPNCNVIRPADPKETYEALNLAFQSVHTPAVIVTSRQNLEVIETSVESVKLGAYVIKEEKNPDHILLATGSEVKLALDAAKLLEETGLKVRVVSMPSEFLFEQQSEEYKNSVLSDRSITTAIEMGTTHGWYKYANRVIGIDVFGLSAPAKDVANYFGFTPQDVVNKILK